MKKVTFLGSKKIGWECLSHLFEKRETLGIKLTQIGTNLGKKCEYRDRFLQLGQQLGHSVFSESGDILLATDILISVQFHFILSPKQLAQASEAAYNLHMAPLPEYRGCNQFSMAILERSPIFGTSIHVMDAGIDHGALVAERRWDIADDLWVQDLYQQTESESLQLFKETLPSLIAGDVERTAQEDLVAERGTSLHYRNEIQELKELDLNWSEEQIDRHIRATYMPGFEPPYFMVEGKKIYASPDYE